MCLGATVAAWWLPAEIPTMRRALPDFIVMTDEQCCRDPEAGALTLPG